MTPMSNDFFLVNSSCRDFENRSSIVFESSDVIWKEGILFRRLVFLLIDCLQVEAKKKKSSFRSIEFSLLRARKNTLISEFYEKSY